MTRLEAQVIDLSELILKLSGRCMALEVAAASATIQPGASTAAPGDPRTSELLDRVYASLLATGVASEFLEGFQETAQAISDAAQIVNTIEGRMSENGR